MGNWNINIQGIGCHHNIGGGMVTTDAEKMAGEFIHSLIKAGHTIEGASFTYGSRLDLVLSPEANGLKQVTSYIDDRPPNEAPTTLSPGTIGDDLTTQTAC